MWLEGILAVGQDGGNAGTSPRWFGAFVRRWRRGGAIRTVAMLFVCALLLAGIPMPFGGMLLPISMLFLGEAEFSYSVRTRRSPATMIAWRLINPLIATTTLLVVGSDSWITAAALGLFIVSCSGIVGGRGLALATVGASAANVLVPMLVEWMQGHPDPFVVTQKSLLLSGLVLPACALLLHQRSHRLLRAQQTLSRTVVELEEAQSDLRASEQRLQEWNRQLNASIEAQTAQLAERNRYLSIINAVSFALAEPMDDERSLERAARLVARLLGARAAQAFHRLGPETAHLFVTVAPEDVHAPRLPEALLRRVAEVGTPVISGEHSGPDLPDLGDAYAVVPITARGQVCGAFALIGIGHVTWGDQERHLLLLIGREIGVSIENMRLYREAMERVRREEVAGGAARLLDAAGQRDQAVGEALHLVGQAVDAWDIALVSIDDDAELAVLRSELHASGYGDDPDAWLTPLLPSLSETLAGRTGPVILGAGGERPLEEATEMLGIGTMVVVPVMTTHGARLLSRGDAANAAPSFERSLSGVLVVAMAAGVPWRPVSTDLIASFADALARRLESDELVALQQQRIRELTGLAEVARTMQSGADVDRLYTGFAHALTGLLPYERVYIARVDEYGQVSGVPSFAASGAREDRELVERDAAHRWFALRSPTMWDAESGAAPAFTEDTDARFLVVPMRPKGQVLGVVAFEVQEAVAGDQLRIVEQAVEQLALALDSANLYHQATERASHIQALSNLARIVASVVDLREAFSAFAEEVRWLIPFDRAVMLLLDESEEQVLPYATYPEEAFLTDPVPLARSIASAPVEAAGAVRLRRSDARYAHLDWEAMGPGVTEVAAVPVRNGVRTAAIFALVQTSPVEVRPDLDALDEVAGLLGVTIERLRLYERAEYSANHDLLTGLPNYRYLQERLYNLRSGLSDAGESSVLMIDMDGLKLFNDMLGHEAGDQAIRIVARELRDCCRSEDFVARTGGDEFVIVMEGVGADDAARAAERIHAAVHEAHLEVAGAPARIGVSIGIATAPQDASSANRLLHAADQAMYAAKFSGGHRTRLARDHEEDVRTRSIPQRDTHLVETVVRTAMDGATTEERQAITAAQRWVVGVVSHLERGPDAAPWVRMLVAQHGLSAATNIRHGRDQEIGRFFLDRLWNEWTQRDDEVARAVVMLTPPAVEIARHPGALADGSASTLGAAIAAARARLPEVTELHEALFGFVLAERVERRRERQAA